MSLCGFIIGIMVAIFHSEGISPLSQEIFINLINFFLMGLVAVKGSSQHKVGGEWFEIKLGKISRMLVKYEVLPIPNVIFVC